MNYLRRNFPGNQCLTFAALFFMILLFWTFTNEVKAEETKAPKKDTTFENYPLLADLSYDSWAYNPYRGYQSLEMNEEGSFIIPLPFYQDKKVFKREIFIYYVRGAKALHIKDFYTWHENILGKEIECYFSLYWQDLDMDSKYDGYNSYVALWDKDKHTAFILETIEDPKTKLPGDELMHQAIQDVVDFLVAEKLKKDAVEM